jgi:hypothetical protein
MEMIKHAPVFQQASLSFVPSPSGQLAYLSKEKVGEKRE